MISLDPPDEITVISFPETLSCLSALRARLDRAFASRVEEQRCFALLCKGDDSQEKVIAVSRMPVSERSGRVLMYALLTQDENEVLEAIALKLICEYPPSNTLDRHCKRLIESWYSQRDPSSDAHDSLRFQAITLLRTVNITDPDCYAWIRDTFPLPQSPLPADIQREVLRCFLIQSKSAENAYNDVEARELGDSGKTLVSRIARGDVSGVDFQLIEHAQELFMVTYGMSRWVIEEFGIDLQKHTQQYPAGYSTVEQNDVTSHQSYSEAKRHAEQHGGLIVRILGETGPKGFNFAGRHFSSLR